MSDTRPNRPRNPLRVYVDFEPGLREAIEAAATKNGVNVSTEVREALKQKYTRPDRLSLVRDWAKQRLKEYKAEQFGFDQHINELEDLLEFLETI